MVAPARALAFRGIFRYHCSAFSPESSRRPCDARNDRRAGRCCQREEAPVSEHYYTERPSAAHEETSFDATLRGMAFRFVTDAGVFSRERVDFGSLLLIEAMQIGQGDTVLDLGCGYGPIGTVAARLAPKGYIYMV